jgi:hypothetical protein
MGSASTYTEIVIALKSAIAGTAPSNVAYPNGWVQRISSENSNAQTSGTFTFQFTSSGNFLFLANACGSSLTPNSVTDAVNTWKSTGTSSGNTTSLLSLSAIANATGAISVGTTGTGDCTFSFYDVAGAPSSQYFSRSIYTRSGTTAGATLPLWSFPLPNDSLAFLPTPSTGLTFGIASTAINTAVAVSAPTGCVFDAFTFGGESLDGPTLTPGDQNNGWMHCSIASYTNAQHAFTMTYATEGTSSTWGEEVGMFGSGAAAIINGGQNRGATVSTLAVTVPATTIGTTSLVSIADYNSTGRTVSSVVYGAGGGGNTFSQCAACAVTSGTNRTEVWYLLSNPAGATTVNITLSGSATQLDAAYLELLKGGGTFAEDVGGLINAGTGTGTTDVGAAVTTTGTTVDVCTAPFNSGASVSVAPLAGNEFSWASDLWNAGNDGGFTALLSTTAGSHTPKVLDGSSGATFSSSTECVK